MSLEDAFREAFSDLLAEILDDESSDGYDRVVGLFTSRITEWEQENDFNSFITQEQLDDHLQNFSEDFLTHHNSDEWFRERLREELGSYILDVAEPCRLGQTFAEAVVETVKLHMSGWLLTIIDDVRPAPTDDLSDYGQASAPPPDPGVARPVLVYGTDTYTVSWDGGPYATLIIDGVHDDHVPITVNVTGSPQATLLAFQQWCEARIEYRAGVGQG